MVLGDAMKTPIIHSFTFFNELELLPMKLEELWDVVDYFLLIESPQTYTGIDKTLWFASHADRFTKYREKLLNTAVSFPDRYGPWDREREQREFALTYLDAKFKDYILLYSDMDEIVSANSIREWLDGLQVPTQLEQRMYYYWLNNLMVSDTWCGGKIMWRKDITRPLTVIRYDGNLPKIKNGGWHFSFLGGPERIKQKIVSYAHSELIHYASAENIDQSLLTGRDIFHRPEIVFSFVPIDGTYPKYLLEHIDAYAHMIKEV